MNLQPEWLMVPTQHGAAVVRLEKVVSIRDLTPEEGRGARISMDDGSWVDSSRTVKELEADLNKAAPA